jgi:hypothetical protein
MLQQLEPPEKHGATELRIVDCEQIDLLSGRWIVHSKKAMDCERNYRGDIDNYPEISITKKLCDCEPWEETPGARGFRYVFI